MGRYAMAYAETSVFPQTVTQTPVKLGYISAYTIFEGADAVPGNNALRVKIPGTYLVTATIALNVDSADNFYISIYKNGIATGFRNGGYVSLIGLSNISVHGVLELDVDDLVELYINAGTAGSYAITVGSAQFSMVGV